MSHFSAVLGRPNALDGNYAPATLKAFRATAKRYAYSTSQGLDTSFPAAPERCSISSNRSVQPVGPERLTIKCGTFNSFISSVVGCRLPFHRDIKVRHALKKE